MKPTIFLFSCLILPAILFSKEKPKNYISFNLASSTALGKYASTKDINHSAFAKNGGSVSIDWARFYCNSGTGNFGLGGTVSVGGHKLDENALQKQFAGKGYNISFNDSSQWMSSTLMFDPVYALKNGPVTVEFKMLGGFYFGKAPDVVVENNEINLPDEYWKFNNNLFDCVGALGYQAGSSVHYQASDHIQLSMKAVFYHSKPKYKIKNTTPNEANGMVENEYAFYQKTSVFDVGFGIGYLF